MQSSTLHIEIKPELVEGLTTTVQKAGNLSRGPGSAGGDILLPA